MTLLELKSVSHGQDVVISSLKYLVVTINLLQTPPDLRGGIWNILGDTQEKINPMSVC